MKKVLAFLFVLFSIVTNYAQVERVKWTTEIEKLSDIEYHLIYLFYSQL